MSKNKKQSKKNNHGIPILNDNRELTAESFKYKEGGKFSVKAFKPRNSTQRQGYASLERNIVNFFIGVVGTGKTYVPVHYAAEQLALGNYKKIVLLRASVTALGEEIGHLKGTLIEKMSPYLRSMLVIMEDLMGAEKVEEFIEKRVIQPECIAFQRGVTHKNSIILLDEVQNCNPDQLRLCLERIDDSSKIIVMGDDKSQRDLPAGVPSAVDNLNMFKGKEGIGFITFKAGDITRGKVTKMIYDCYAGFSKDDYNEVRQEFDAQGLNKDKNFYNNNSYTDDDGYRICDDNQY